MARVAHGLGVRLVRVTGGEPLVRRGLELIGMLAEIGFDDLSMTTNGIGLDHLAPALADAGLRRVNISCDSLKPERFAELRRRGTLPPVLAAMDAAEAAGLTPVKVNVVVLAGENDDEIVDFAAVRPPDRPRGPLHRVHAPRRRRVLAPRRGRGRRRRSCARSASSWPLEPRRARPTRRAGHPVSLRRRRREIGVIPTVTRALLRHLRPAPADRRRRHPQLPLRRPREPVRDRLRAGAGDDEIADALRRAVGAKLPGHGINDPGFLRPARSMSMIGG